MRIISYLQLFSLLPFIGAALVFLIPFRVRQLAYLVTSICATHLLLVFLLLWQIKNLGSMETPAPGSYLNLYPDFFSQKFHVILLAIFSAIYFWYSVIFLTKNPLSLIRAFVFLLSLGCCSIVLLAGNIFTIMLGGAALMIPQLLALGLFFREDSGKELIKIIFMEAVFLVFASFALIGFRELESSSSEWVLLEFGSYVVKGRSLLFFSLLGALLSKCLILPFSLSRLHWMSVKPIGLVVVLLLNSFLWLAILPPFVFSLFAPEWQQFGEVLSVLAVVSCLWSYIKLSQSRDARESVLFGASGLQSSILLGLACANVDGIVGALALMPYAIAAVAIFGVLLCVAEERGLPLVPDLSRGESYSISYVLNWFLLCSLPFSVGSMGLFLVAKGASNGPVILSLFVVAILFSLVGFAAWVWGRWDGAEGTWASQTFGVRDNLALFAPITALMCILLFSAWYFGGLLSLARPSIALLAGAHV